MQNKETAIHFTKIARDKFQVYNFETKENHISNTRDLANYLVNLRGGITLDNAFYSRLISMPNFSTIAITKDALKIVKRASTTKIEPWKIEKSADGEVFVSAIEDEEEDKDLKKCASANLKHHYIISVKAKNENQKFMTYASLKKQACIPEANIAIEPVDNCVNFDYESEKNPYQVIQAIVDLLVATGVAVTPDQVSCCHDFCDCGMDHVGPIVPCKENEYILDCYGEEPIIGQSLDSLQSFASAHNKKHFKIYAYDKMVFDSDATISRKAENENKNVFTMYLYSDTDNLVDQHNFKSFKEAEDAFLNFKKEWAEKKENPALINYVKIKESDNNGKVINAWEGTDTGSLIPTDVPAEGEVKVIEPTQPVQEKVETKEEVKEEATEPQPLPVGEKKEEVEEKVETPEGQKLEEKVEETVQPKQASLKVSAAEESIEGWLKVEVDALNEKEEQEKGKDAANLLTMNTYENKVVVGGDTQKLLELEPKVKDKLNHYNMKYLVSVTPVEDIEGQSNLTIFTDMKGSWTDKFAGKKEELNKKSELNADPKVVVNKLETGDLLPGTEERKDGIKKLVNDKSKKEVVEDLKDKGHITEKEIEDVKKEDIEKKSNTNISGKTLDELITNLEKEGYIIKDFQPGLPKASVSAEKDGKKFNIEVSTMLNDDGNNDHRVTNIKEHTEITTDDNIEKESKVVKQDGKYQAQSEKGKNFGTYDTKEEAKERVKQMEMFKHMDKKSAASNLIGVTVTYDNGDVITTDVNGNQTDEQIKEYFKVGKEFNLGNGEKDNIAKVVKVDIDRGNIEKEAEKVLIDKNTNQPIKPGDTTEGKELKEVEVEKTAGMVPTEDITLEDGTTYTVRYNPEEQSISTIMQDGKEISVPADIRLQILRKLFHKDEPTIVEEKTASPIYNLFMKSATIEVNKNELALLTAAYNSTMFQKLAYFGPTAFAFKDKDATFIVDNNTATCTKTADLTQEEIKKHVETDPASLEALTDKELQEYINHLNSKFEVK